MSSRIAKWMFLLACAAGLAPAAFAATVTWVNPVSGNWGTAANWSSGTVPGSGDDVVIDAAGTYTVTVNVAASVNSLTVSAASGTPTLANASQTLTIGIGGGTVGVNGAINMTGGTLTVNGPLTVNGSFTFGGGTINGSSKISNNGTFTMSGVSSKGWHNVALDNSGTFVSNSGSYIYLFNAPVFNNLSGGTYDIQTDSGYYIGSGGAPIFNNSGIVTKSAGTGIKDFYFQFNNNNQLDVQSGSLRLASGGTSSGDYAVSSGATLQFYGGTHTLNATASVTGAGSVIVTSGTVGIASDYNVTGATTVSGGTLTLTGNVLSLGTLSTSSGTLNLNTNTTTTALGSVTISGGTLNLNSTAAFTMSGLTLSSGTLGGTSSVTINGTFAWSGGFVNRTGTVNVPSPSVLNITTGSTKYLYTTLNTNGAVTSSGGGWIYFYSSAVFNLQSGGTLDFQSDGGWYVGSGTPVFNNAGTVTRSGGTGNADIYIQFNNSGQLNVQTGTVRIANGGTSSGDYAVSAGATIQFNGGTHTLDATASLTGGGSVAVSSGTVSVAGDYNITTATTVNGGTLNLTGNVLSLGTLSVSSGTFNLNTNTTITALGAVTLSGGTLDLKSTAAFTMTSMTHSGGTFGGSSAVTINGSYAWSAGTINRTGSITFPAGSAFNISGTSTKYLQTTTVQNSGTATSTSTGAIYLYTTTFNNLSGATYDIQSDGGYYVGSGTSPFNNSGTVTKSAGTGIKDFYFQFNNNNQLNVQSGTLRLGNGGTSSGAYNVSSGAVLNFLGGTHTLDASATIAGAGSVTFQGGTVTLAGTYNVTGGTTNSGTATTLGSVTAMGPVSISNGTLTLNGAAITLASLTLTNGTLAGTAPLTITTLGWSAGTINRTGKITLPVGSTTTISGASTKYLYSLTIDNSGTVTSTSTGSIYLYNGMVFNNLAGATYDIQSDSGYYTGANPISTFNNAGTLTKSAGTGIKEFYFIVNNTNQVSVQTGTLRLANGGTSSGDYSVASGATLQFYGGTHTLDTNVAISGAGSAIFSSGTVTLAGDYNITGGTTFSGGTFNANGTVTATGPVTLSGGDFNLNTAATYTLASLTLSGGTLGGSGVIDINGTFAWSGGTVNRTGQVNILSGSFLNITGATTKYWYQATLANSGTINSGSTGSLYVYNGASLNNLAGGQWNMTSTGGYYIGSGAPSINNSGTITKNTSTGQKDIGIAFNNNGQVNIDTGILRPYSGGTSSGTFTIASGATLRFGGTHNLTAASTITGAGTFDVDTGTTSTAGAYTVTGTTSITGGILNLNSASTVTVPTISLTSGTLGGSAPLALTGTWTWSGGSVNRSGAVAINTGATLNMTGTAVRYWQQATLNNSGTITSAAVFWLYVYDSAILNNLSGATWQLPPGDGLYGASGTPVFNNSGTVNKNSGATETYIYFAFNNSNQLNLTSGILRLQGGGTSTGTYSVGSGTTLRFWGGTHTLNNPATITGAGNVEFNSGTVNLNGSYAATGTTIGGATLNVDTTAALTLGTLTMTSGILGGAQTLNISTLFDFSGGTVNRSGAVNINSGATLNMTGTAVRYWYQATLNNSGNVTSGASFWIYAYNGAVFNNLAGATWQLPSGDGLYHAGGAAVQFNNSGTVNKNSGSTESYMYLVFNNNNLLNVTAGTLRFLTGGGTGTGGTYSVGGGATLRFAGGTHTLDAASTITGAGTVDLTAGTVVFAGSYNVSGATSISGGTFEINSASTVTLNALNFSNGTLAGTGTVSFAGTSTWSSGTINRSGIVEVPSGATLNMTTTSVKYLYQATVNNSGVINFNGGMWLYVYNGAIINNLSGATFDMQGNNGIYYAGGAAPQFNNSGLVKKSAGTTSQDIGIAFNNNGQLQVQASTLRLTNGGTSSGNYDVSSGATLRFDGGTHTLGAAASITGAGTADFGAGTVSVAGTYNITGTTTTVSGGTLNLNGTITSVSPLVVSSGIININAAATTTINSLTLSGGTLGGTSALIVNTFNWTAGTISRSGAIDIPSGGAMNLTGLSARYHYQAAINNSGTVTSTMTGSVSSYNGAVLNNLAGGVVDLQSDGGFFYGGGTYPQFHNSGTLKKSAGTGNQTFAYTLNNSGSFELGSGILFVSNGYTQTSAGVTKVSIGGTTAGTQYARASITGTASLNGALNVLLTGGFTPTVGDAFQILTFGTRSGDFATKTGLTYAGGSMSYAANATNITLTGATATADLSITKTSSLATVPTGGNYSYTLSVNNGGPSAATNATVTDTLPSGVSLNSVSGTGWTCNSDGGTPPTITCTMASLATGAANPITASVTAPASPTTVNNTASITSSVGDPTSSNDTSSVSTNIVTPTVGYTVTTNADSGAGSLRQGILDANTGVCSAPCTIGFNMSPLAPIQPTTALPALSTSMTIDATTQPGYSGTPLIEIDGSSCASCGEGLSLAGTNITVRGVWIYGFSGSSRGLRIAGSGTHTFELSKVGHFTTPNATGIAVTSSNNVIRNNSIWNNTGNGVEVTGSTGVRLLGNNIFDNGSLGIDLGANGADTNDAGDGDSGANNFQNTPVISAAQASSGNLDVTLSVDSSSVSGTGSIRVEIFEADANGEGKEYLGGACFAGNAITNQIVTVPATNITTGDSAVATATSFSSAGCVSVGDGTSEFSAAQLINTCTPPDATITAPSGTCSNVSGYTASVPFVAGATYTWTITNGTIDSGAGTSSISFTAGATGSVDLQVTVNDNGCSTNGNVSIPINTAAAASITPDGPTTFCAGGSVNLSASNGTGYLWSNGATTQSINVTASGTFTVAVTDVNGCVANSAPVTVTVNPLPSVTITGPAATCETGSVILDAGAGFATYQWSTGETTQQITVSPSVTTTYTVVVYDANNCSATDDHEVVVSPNPAPVITPSGPTTFCSGGSVTLSSSPAGSYQWFKDGNPLGGETNATLFVNVAGSYTVTATSGSCSGTSAPTVVTVNNTTTPTVTPGGPTTFCAGGSVTLTSSAGASYQWNLDGTPINAANGVTYVATATGNYSVTVTDANGCVATSGETSVTVDPAPVVNITGPTATCAGSPVTLDAGAGFAIYQWSTGETTRLITVTPTVTTNYNVTVYDANNCSALDSHTVTATANPTAVITAPTAACASSPNNNASVAVQPGATYNWSITNGTIDSGNGSNAITFTAGPSGNVQLDVIVAIGSCTANGSASVVINTPPTVTITGNASMCPGGSVDLDAGAGFNTYQWSTGETSRVITVSPASTANYSVIVTDANNCSATDAHTVTVTPTPVVNIIGPSGTCPSTPVTLDAGAGFTSYAWSSGETTQQITVSPATDTTYTVIVYDGNNCSATDQHTVTVAASPSTIIAAPQNVCAGTTGHTASVAAQPGATYAWTISGGSITAGQNSDIITFTAGPSGNVQLDVIVTIGSCTANGTASVVINTPPTVTITGNASMCPGGSVDLDAGAGFNTYQWSTGQTSRVITVSPGTTTNYSVIVTDGNNCSATDAHTVTVNPAPSVNILGPTSTCPSTPVTLDAGTGFTSYAWSTGETTQQITVTPVSNTTYTVVVNDGNNCSATDQHTVTVAASPSTIIAAPQNVCAGSTGHTASVAAQPGATYAWTISGGSITAGQNSDIITFTAGPSGNVALGVTVTIGSCVNNGSANVPISAPPSVTISGPAAVCANVPFTLSVPANFVSYAWSTGQTTPSIQITQGASSATYSVTVVDANGCSAIANHVVTATAPDATITAPTSVESNSFSNPASVPAQPGATYTWSIVNGNITGGAGTNAITFTSGLSGSVDLMVDVVLNGCTANGTRSVPIGTPQQQNVDFAITKSGPATVQAGSTLVWTIGVSNLASTGSNGTIIDVLPAGVVLANYNDGHWTCNVVQSQMTCNGFLDANASHTITITATAPQQPATITNRAIVETQVSDSNPNNNESTATTQVTPKPVACPITPPSLLSPANGAVINSPLNASWTAVSGTIAYEVWITQGGATFLAVSTTATSASINVQSGPGTIQVIARQGTGCEALASEVRSFTAQEANGCSQRIAPQITSPVNGAVVTSPLDVSWMPSPQAIGYRVLTEVNGTAAQDIGTTDGAITLRVNLPPGSNKILVDALHSGCPPVRSAGVTVEVPAPDPCANRGVATLIAPANNAIQNASSVFFQFDPPDNASESRVWASIDGGAPQLLGTTTDDELHAVIHHGEVIWWVENPYDGCASTESLRRRLVIPQQSQCGNTKPEIVVPANNAEYSDGHITIDWNGIADALGYEIHLAFGNGAPALIGTTGPGVTEFTHIVSPGEYEVAVRALVDRCDPRDSQKRRFKYEPPAACENYQRPVLISPLDQAVLTAPLGFEWSFPLGATKFDVFVIRGTSAPALIATTTANSLPNVNLALGKARWRVRAYFDGCSPLDSDDQDLEVVAPPPLCAALAAPVITAPGEISNGVQMLVQWNSIPGATGYQLQISSNPGFEGAQIVTTTATSHQVLVQSSDLYFRVRAIASTCTPLPVVSAYSATAATFAISQQGTDANVPLNNPTNVQYSIPISAGFAGQTFTAISLVDWLTVFPASGVVGTNTVLTATANTAGLGVGGHTGGISISFSEASRGVVTHGTSTVTPISVSLVTPVTSAPKNTPPPDAMIIPAVANAAGINAYFQSDVRVANTSPQLIKYQLTFTPSGDTALSASKQTTFSVEPGRTVALDDILKSWFGTGTANASGWLEIRPLTKTSTSTSGAPSGALANLVSFASSRTYNATSKGTFGTNVPAIPFANFAGKNTILSLQQIAQTTKMRTNLGLLEGSGDPAEVLIKVFGGNGQMLTQFTQSLKGGQHTQLNSILFQKGITLEDGRMEVEVISDKGKITAYAGVLDNETADTVMVNPIALSAAGNTKWVVPGVADIRSGFADWQSDMRIFNAGSEPAEITASFYSQGGGEPKVTTLTLAAGEVRQLDKVLPTLFGINNDGGAMHLSTTKASRIIATARTYNQTPNGTYGQFINAVTASEAAGVGSRPLQLLQIEESMRYRSNIAFVEVTGKPVKLEVTITPPDAKFTVTTEVELGPNEFRQFGSMLAALGLGETYNARISVRAVEGEGRAMAYAAVIDLQTNDPMLVQAQ